jgi:hypothetical protein
MMAIGRVATTRLDISVGQIETGYGEQWQFLTLQPL